MIWSSGINFNQSNALWSNSDCLREIYHSSSETHEQILEISPGGFAHSLAVRTFEAGETGDKFSVTLTQLVTAAVSSFSVSN